MMEMKMEKEKEEKKKNVVVNGQMRMG